VRPQERCDEVCQNGGLDIRNCKEGLPKSVGLTPRGTKIQKERRAERTRNATRRILGKSHEKKTLLGGLKRHWRSREDWENKKNLIKKSRTGKRDSTLVEKKEVAVQTEGGTKLKAK